MTAAARTSAGLLLHRAGPDGTEVLIGRMGGPFWARKPHAWTVPKGEPLDGEDPHATALREFAEEVGVPAPDGPDVDLGEVRQRAGKVVRVWARAATLDLGAPRGPVSEVTVEWPPRSGRSRTFPELKDLRWVPVEEARGLVVTAQAELLDRLLAHLAGG
ncbi:NUDIX domain-containing protein [Cellulomonas pakistanensis]|nr:NUDIX domain-containing protein [Cellulomonas pakistanensis]